MASAAKLLTSFSMLCGLLASRATTQLSGVKKPSIQEESVVSLRPFGETEQKRESYW